MPASLGTAPLLGPQLSVHPLVLDNLAVLEQGDALVAELGDGEYADASWSGSSIGGHLRHVLDHYACLLRGLEAGVVDYDARERDPQIETDRGHARAVIARTAAALRAIDPASPLSVQLHAGQTACEHIGVAPSSLERELMFVLLHAVHHYALIANELRARGLGCSPTFGVAPSTLGYRGRSG